MRIIGHGVDVVEVSRIARMLEEHAERFETRVFTPEEIASADARPRRRAEHLAGRFAVKEAVLKALGTGWRGGIQWTDIEAPAGRDGRPRVRLSGEAAGIAAELGVESWAVSISHTGGLAMASAIATGP